VDVLSGCDLETYCEESTWFFASCLAGWLSEYFKVSLVLDTIEWSLIIEAEDYISALLSTLLENSAKSLYQALL